MVSQQSVFRHECLSFRLPYTLPQSLFVSWFSILGGRPRHARALLGAICTRARLALQRKNTAATDAIHWTISSHSVSLRSRELSTFVHYYAFSTRFFGANTVCVCVLNVGRTILLCLSAALFAEHTVFVRLCLSGCACGCAAMNSKCIKIERAF